MARKKTPTLTEAELKIMTVVWEKNEASVHDVLAALPGEPKLAYNTVLTTMRILEQKGYLMHAKSGRAFVYRPLVNRSHARSKAVRQMISSFFDESPELLMLSLIQDSDITPEELHKLKDMIDEKAKR